VAEELLDLFLVAHNRFRKRNDAVVMIDRPNRTPRAAEDFLLGDRRNGTRAPISPTASTATRENGFRTEVAAQYVHLLTASLLDNRVAINKMIV